MSYQHKILISEQSFVCVSCGTTVEPATSGTDNVNHCPHCLTSRHVDLKIGDRANRCRGTMVPVGLWVKESGEWSLIHRCSKCGFIRSNRLGPDDDPAQLLALAIKPLAALPFPLSVLGLGQ